jgi:hypothetical protein
MMKRPLIFVVQIAWLLALAAGAAVYFLGKWPPELVNLGSIPIGVVFFGAVGAVIISLTGIVEHADDWDPRFELWHLSRPLVGASLAVVGVLIVEAGVLAAGTNPATPVSGGAPKNLLYYLVAFLVGYREETFRDLVRRLVDLIFTPAPAPPKPALTSLNPDNAPHAGGAAVKIIGSGFQGATAVSFGSAPATFKVDSDTQISAVVPAATTAGAVNVTVKTKGGSATGSFNYT